MDLNDIIILINSCHNADEIFHTVVEESRKGYGCETARIAMREGDNLTFSDTEVMHTAITAETKRSIVAQDVVH